MKNHHISEAGVSFEIQFSLCIKIWAGKTHFLHMAANYRFKARNSGRMSSGFEVH